MKKQFQDDLCSYTGKLYDNGLTSQLHFFERLRVFFQERVMQHATYFIKTEPGYEISDFHSLLHTHATKLCEEGINIKESQRCLG